MYNNFFFFCEWNVNRERTHSYGSDVNGIEEICSDIIFGISPKGLRENFSLLSKWMHKEIPYRSAILFHLSQLHSWVLLKEPIPDLWEHACATTQPARAEVLGLHCLLPRISWQRRLSRGQVSNCASLDIACHSGIRDQTSNTYSPQQHFSYWILKFTIFRLPKVNSFIH